MTSRTLVDLTVADVLARWPAAAHVFVRLGTSCVGCPFAPFETVADVAANYHLDPMELATALLQAAPRVNAKPKGPQS